MNFRLQESRGCGNRPVQAGGSPQEVRPARNGNPAEKVTGGEIKVLMKLVRSFKK